MMKRFLLLFSLFILLFPFFTLSQTSNEVPIYKKSWGIGFGLSYPRYISTSSGVNKEANYGGFLSIQRNYSEHTAIRWEINYLHLEGSKPAILNNVIASNLDLVFSFLPCEQISPFIGFGAGGDYYTISKSPYPELNKSFIDYHINLLFGANFRMGERWRLKTELSYHSTGSTKFDGTYGTEGWGIFGGTSDTYMKADLGLIYLFALGDRSTMCDIYSGMESPRLMKIDTVVTIKSDEPSSKAPEVDYDRIEQMIKKQINMAVGSGFSGDDTHWILMGINFDNNKANLRPESYPILTNAAEILLKNRDIQIEVQGHTDNVGSAAANKKLSLKRAETVKNFLISRGIGSERIKVQGYGSSIPVMDNKTAEGRSFNRRIEFRVVN